jgi:hypothetical protein
LHPKIHIFFYLSIFSAAEIINRLLKLRFCGEQPAFDGRYSHKKAAPIPECRLPLFHLLAYEHMPNGTPCALNNLSAKKAGAP